MLTYNGKKFSSIALKGATKLNKSELKLCKPTGPNDIGVAWSPEKIERICNAKKFWVLGFDEDMSSGTIRKLFLRHITSPHCSSSIMREIAEHPNTPLDILRTLARIAGNDILFALSSNRKITQDIVSVIIDRAVNDCEPLVLERLIFNRKTPKEVLINLKKKPPRNYVVKMVNQALEFRKNKVR